MSRAPRTSQPTGAPQPIERTCGVAGVVDVRAAPSAQGMAEGAAVAAWSAGDVVMGWI